jgi:hypothetical protein
MAVTLFHTKPTLRGYHMEDWSFTFNLAAGITGADVGKAVSVDASGPNKVKLSGDTDVIIGRLETVEDRTVEGQLVGAVELKFANTLPIKTGETVVVGGSVQGAGAGEVKPLAANYALNFVAEIIGTSAVVVKV